MLFTTCAFHDDEPPAIEGKQSGKFRWLELIWNNRKTIVTIHRVTANDVRAMARKLDEIADKWEPPLTDTQEIPIVTIHEAHVNAAMQSIGEPDEIDETPDTVDEIGI